MTKLFRVIAFVCLLALGGAAFAQTAVPATQVTTPQGRSRQVIYTLANPAAGAEITLTVPAGKVWRVISMSCILTTNATVANRSPAFTFDDGTNTVYKISASQVEAASSGVFYLIQGENFQAYSNAGFIQMPVLRTLLGPGYRIRSSTTAIQTGDQYSAIVLLVEEWSR